MDVVDVVTEMGGVMRRSALLSVVARADVEAAEAAGRLIRDSRGLFTVAGADAARVAAERLGGVLCLTSAALHHGWAVKWPPARPHILVSRGRKLDARRRHGVEVHRGEVGRGDVDGHATSRDLTLLQCLRALPFDEALAVADSALREGYGQEQMRGLADSARGPGARRIRRVADQATALSANPFESVLRAICLEVPGLDVEAQVQLPGARPDLVDRRLRLVLEADSFEWHGGREALARDARRYNALVVDGWVVLRFSWEDVMRHPHLVRDTLIRAVALAEVLTQRPPGARAAA